MSEQTQRRAEQRTARSVPACTPISPLLRRSEPRTKETVGRRRPAMTARCYLLYTGDVDGMATVMP